MLTQTLPTSASEYSRTQRREIQAALAAIGVEWSRMGNDFDTSWARIGPNVAAILRTAQRRIVDQSIDYIPDVLEDTDQVRSITARASIEPAALVGISGAGLPVEDVTSWAPVRAKQAVEDGATGFQAIQQAGNWLSLAAGTILSDTGRATEALGMYTRPVNGWVRMLVPPSCARCAILAGRWYRKNAGFQRHPRCDCRHIPASESIASDLTLDPQAYFDSLDPAGQIKLAGSRANAEAIRDGADLGQVVNAYRRTAGMRFAQVSPIKRVRNADGTLDKFTTEGSTVRGAAFQQQTGLRRNGSTQARLMPESIARIAKNDADRMRLLKLYGWITDDAARARGRAVLAAERRATRNERARQRRAGAGTGGTTPPRVPGGGGNGSTPPPSRPGRQPGGPDEASRAYWKARQELLPVDFGPELLQPHEVAFVEAFVAVGHSLRWIPVDVRGFRSTNDFVWSSNGGIEVEVKSPQVARYASIRGRITDAVSRARKHGVTKENFIIDLRSEALTDDLREQLTQFNMGRRDRIAGLWVMTRGRLEQIDLAE